MKKNLILIRHTENFSVRSMVMELEEGGFSVLSSPFDMTSYDEVKDKADTVLLYLGRSAGPLTDDDTGFFFYLEALMESSPKALYVIGDEEAIQFVLDSAPDLKIQHVFPDPPDLTELALYLKTGRPPADSGEEEDGPSSENGTTRSILMVDDDPVYLRTIRNWLKDDYDVTIATSGMEAIKWLTSHRPDLILLDYSMPILDGPTLFQMIREEETTADIPVMFLTGKADSGSVTPVLAMLPDGYLLKTLPKIQLLKKLRQFFQNH